jgi:hypothetical protein
MSNELFYLDKNGKKQDASLHAEILNNFHADNLIARNLINKAVAEEMPLQTALFLYGNPDKSKQVAEARADDWWDQLTRKEQLIYLKAHPRSIYKNKVKITQVKIKQKEQPFPAEKPRISVAYKVAKLGMYDRENTVKLWEKNLANVDPDILVSSLLGGKKFKSIKIESDTKESSIDFNTDNFRAIRFFTRDENGLHIRHQYFKVDVKKQGKGVAKEFLKHSIATYQKMGAKDITLEANIDVGGYAWAKFGFVPNDWKALKTEISKRLKHLNLNSETVQYVEQLFLSRDSATIRKIAYLNTPVKIPLLNKSNFINYNFKEFVKKYNNSTLSLGKALLLGTSWEGKLDLHDKESMQCFDAYINGK